MYQTFTCRDGRFQLGDEIINVNGKSLRGLSIDEARYLLKSSCSSISSDVDIILARDPPPAPILDNSGMLQNESSGYGSQHESFNSNPSVPPLSQGQGNGANPTPVERRRRRRLPFIERPRSAPIHTLPGSLSSDDERSFLHMLHQQSLYPNGGTVGSGDVIHNQRGLHVGGGGGSRPRNSHHHNGGGSSSCDNMTMSSSNSVMDLNNSKEDSLFDAATTEDESDPNGTLKTVIKIGTHSQSIEHHHHHIHRLPSSAAAGGPPFAPASARLHNNMVSRQNSQQQKSRNYHFSKNSQYSHGPSYQGGGRTLPSVSGCVDTTPYMTPAQSVENFYSASNTSTDMMMMEAMARRNRQMQQMSISADSELDRYSVVSESQTECSEVGSVSSTMASATYNPHYVTGGSHFANYSTTNLKGESLRG